MCSTFVIVCNVFVFGGRSNPRSMNKAFQVQLCGVVPHRSENLQHRQDKGTGKQKQIADLSGHIQPPQPAFLVATGVPKPWHSKLPNAHQFWHRFPRPEAQQSPYGWFLKGPLPRANGQGWELRRFSLLAPHAITISRRFNIRFGFRYVLLRASEKKIQLVTFESTLHRFDCCGFGGVPGS